WESFGKIKDALMDKQYQQEDIQELMNKLLEDVRNIREEFLEYINCPSWNRPLFYFDNEDDEYIVIWRRPKAITPHEPSEEPEYPLIIRDKHFDTIPKTESDEIIKSSVENLVPIPSESEDFSDNESECDMPECDEPFLTFTTFSNPLFDSNNDFTSSDDESLSVDPHSFNVKSNLIESFLNQDTLIDSLPKIDYLLKELSGEFAHINPTPLGIEKADFDLEEEICLVKNLLVSLSPSPILIVDSDSHMEEIDLFLASDDSMPPGIENDDYDSEGDIRFLEELLNNDSLPLPKNESSNLDYFNDPSPSCPPSKPPDVEICFDFKPDTGVVTNKVVGDISEHGVLMPNI
ncbi:hypothetical protein Tco_1277820, partial [Tanacetum coccineum]